MRANTGLGPAVGAGRLGVLLALLLGLLVMHGITATDAMGAHHSPIAGAAAEHHGSAMPGDGHLAHAADEAADPVGETSEGSRQGLMVSCLLATVGVVAAVVLRHCLGRFRALTPARASLRDQWDLAGSPRPAPRQRPRHSLCVLRV